jgi:cell shape-determining protein MreD
MLIGYSGELLQKRFPKNSKITLIIMSSITTGGYELLRVCYRYMFYSSHIAFIQFVTTLSIELLFNAILIIILYPIINRIGIIADDTFNGNDAITKYF